MQTHPSKPFLKCAGGKQRLVSDLKPFCKPGRRLIEPFVGAGSMTLALPYPSLVLNDANTQLMNLWREVKEHPHLLIQMARKVFIETNNNAAAYNRLRAEFNSNPDSTGLWQACLFLYLNQFGLTGVIGVESSSLRVL